MTFSAPKQGWFPGFADGYGHATQCRGADGTVSPTEAGYPAQLLALPNPPKFLWWVGRLPVKGQRLVAMVGARSASRAACDCASQIAHDHARAGATIVSGGAFGIDAAAHEGALAAGGSTFAVLGCGTDVAYPDRHVGLFARIGRTGALLSEYAPGTKPRPGQFPARNRIIAALASAVVVVEAAARSGALITASWGQKLGKPVFAVAGSPGTDSMIREGRSVAVASADDVERALAGQVVSTAFTLAAQPSPAFAPLLDAIASGADTPASLCRRLGTSLPSVLGMLAEVELEGWVRRAGGIYEVIGRGC
jgi:DNA processing protein